MDNIAGFVSCYRRCIQGRTWEEERGKGLVWFFLLSFIFSPFSIFLAQRDINTDLPLVTVSTALGWIPSGDEVGFSLPEDAFVKLSIYSPSVDLTEIGDELYAGQSLDTTFTFGSDSTVINTQTYPLAPSEWVIFYEGSLSAARYVLRSEVVGKGKNVYLLKLETSLPNIVLQAHTVTVNVSSLDFADTFTFDITQNNACQLEFYDGDGPSELEAQLVLPTGYVQAIAVSADLETTTQFLPRLKGTYTVQLRLPPNTYQKTNSVRFKMLCDHESQLLTHTPSNQIPTPEPKPIVVVVIDTNGNALEIPYTVSDSLNRDIVLADDIVYRLVEVHTEGGEQLSERTVRFGLEGGKVTYVLEKLEPLPLPKPEAQIMPPVLIPLPEPKLIEPTSSLLVLARTLDRNALLPCQVEQIILTIQNNGDATGTFTLREVIPQGYLIVSSGDAMVEGNTLIWQGEVAAGERKAFSYQLQLTSNAQAQSSLLATLETPDNILSDEASIYRYDILTTLERVSPEGTLYVGDEASYQITFDNPLDREVTLTPQLASSRLTLLETPESVIVPAKSFATVTVKARVETDGTAILRATPFACDAGFTEEHPAGNTADLHEEALVVLPLPDALQNTTVIVDMAAYRLPVIDGTSQNYAGVFGEPGVYLRMDIVFDEQWTCGAGSISEQTFIDQNPNGVREADEAGLAGLEIKLLSANGELLKTTYSASSGAYSFTVKPGQYILQIELPQHYSFSPLYSGNPSMDSDINQNRQSNTLDVGWSQQVGAIDIGIIKSRGTR